MYFRQSAFLTTLIFGTWQLCTLPANAQTPLKTAASLLIFPETDTTPGHDTFFTVTNTNQDTTPLPSGIMAGTIKVEFVRVDGDNCFEFNRTQLMPPADTITVLSSVFFPTLQTRGYVYAFARSPVTNTPISFNWLIGSSTVLIGASGDYTVEPFTFRSPMAEGVTTDVDADGKRDLDGIEYEACADQLLIPRFHGQSPGITQSHLVLLNLTGSQQFDASVEILLFDDNENAFSVEHTFRCWTKVPLASINGAFTNAFLQQADDPSEPIGAPAIENGWFRVDGLSASSIACTAPDPAILGFLIEAIGASRSASLPFASAETQTNGSLRDTSILIGDCTQFVAVDDVANVCANELGPHPIDVLLNDIGSIDCGSVVITDAPDHGVVIISPGCSFPICPNVCLSYVPNSGFIGTDTFTYRSSAAGNPAVTDTAVVTIRVGAVDAVDDFVTVIAGSSDSVNVFANDTATPPFSINCASLLITTPPAHGTVVLAPCFGGPCGGPCPFYTPAAGFTGTDSFKYSIAANGPTPCVDVAQVTISVVAPPPPKPMRR